MTTTYTDGNPDPGLGQVLKRRIIIQTLNIHINLKKIFVGGGGKYNYMNRWKDRSCHVNGTNVEIEIQYNRSNRLI